MNLNKSDGRQRWKEEDMASAIKAVQNKTMGYTLAVKTFNVPRTTLRRRIKKNQGSNKGYLGGYKPTFNANIEAEIADHIRRLETRFFGLTSVELRRLVFQIAEKTWATSPFQ
ncbi:hypothetical protein NQ318_009103 [Aromia moschata]|uniref:HTH psq-type domain-containing protein n=1 Tax=Aromia moschata TaxID=1265417 RepID=A0AAV8XPH7_9CUCU|nr:hypothetical protein NQ318_009103 [Aromia moschata]